MSSEAISIEDVRAVARAYAEVVAECVPYEAAQPMVAAFRAGDTAKACGLGAPFAAEYREKRGRIDDIQRLAVCRAAFAFRALANVLVEYNDREVPFGMMSIRADAAMSLQLRAGLDKHATAESKRAADVEAARFIDADKIAAAVAWACA
jgi:hypothetical protein